MPEQLSLASEGWHEYVEIRTSSLELPGEDCLART